MKHKTHQLRVELSQQRKNEAQDSPTQSGVESAKDALNQLVLSSGQLQMLQYSHSHEGASDRDAVLLSLDTTQHS